MAIQNVGILPFYMVWTSFTT